MSLPLSPTRLLVCSACGAVLPVGEELLGKKCRCGRCGKISVVTDDSSPPQAEQPPAPEDRIGFFCRVCDTRLAARVKDVGRKAKCPDCGALTAVPPAAPPQPKKDPRAMHGQQYGVWGVDEAPTPAEMFARQPKFFPVWCRVCDTLMHARPEQVGKKLKCPDCGGKTPVVEPPPPKPKKSALVPDGSEYQLDATHIAPVRPVLQFQPPQPKEETSDVERIRVERSERPKLPTLPTLQGVMPMLVRMPVVGWFLWLSGMGLTVGALLVVVVSFNPVAAIPFFIAAGVSAVLGAGALAAICLAVLTESSEGNDRLYNPPGPVFLDWIGEVFYLVTSSMLALAPWWLLCRVLETQISLELQGVIMLVGWLFTFPLLLLSCLENGSPLELFSAKVYSSVTHCPAHWLLLVLQSSALMGVAVLAIAALALTTATVALLSIPLGVAACLLYFRILGRFAWWLAENEKLQSDD